jgi:hypothetical protein
MGKSAVTAGGGMEKKRHAGPSIPRNRAENGETFHGRHLAFEAGRRSPRADRHTRVVIDAPAQQQFDLRQLSVMIL